MKKFFFGILMLTISFCFASGDARAGTAEDVTTEITEQKMELSAPQAVETAIIAQEIRTLETSYLTLESPVANSPNIDIGLCALADYNSGALYKDKSNDTHNYNKMLPERNTLFEPLSFSNKQIRKISKIPITG